MFTKAPHVFQNLGDGTYYHSGYLAIRQAIAAKANDHLQDPLQRRGRDDRRPAGRRQHLGDRRSRARSRPRARSSVVVRQRRHRASTTASHDQFPAGTDVPSTRDELDAVQRALREIDGRDRPDLRPDLRRREAPAPQEEASCAIRRSACSSTRRVCEGCGDCGVQSNCLAVVPVETELGPQAPDRPVVAATRTTPASTASARASSR